MSRLIDADALIVEIEKRRKAAKTLTGIDMVMLLKDAPTVSRWISVKDRMPEEYIDVLVLVQYPKVNGYTGHYVVIAWKSTDDDSWDSDNNNFNNDPEGVVTHWMPLPELQMEDEDAPER